MSTLTHTYALSNATILSLIAAQAVTANLNGTGVDIHNMKGDAVVVLDVGTPSGTGETLNVKLQDSPDNSTWTDVPGAAFPQDGTTGGIASLVIRPNERSKYLRAVATVAGTSPSYPLSCHIVGCVLP